MKPLKLHESLFLLFLRGGRFESMLINDAKNIGMMIVAMWKKNPLISE